MPILICQQCGRMFEVAPSREHSARYCSKECQLAATQKKEAKCECCGKEFNPLNRKNPRFCSRICASAAQSGLSREAYLAKKSADKADPSEGKHLCAPVRWGCRQELRAVDHRLQVPGLLGKAA